MTMILLLIAIAFALLVLVRFIELVIHFIWPKPNLSVFKGDAAVFVQITPKQSVNSDKAGDSGK